MKTKQWVVVFGMMVCLTGLISSVYAATAVVETEVVPGFVVTEKFVRTADNFVVLFDSSSSMKAPYKDTGMTTLEVAKKFLKDRNEMLPDLGFNAGLYLYTPFKALYDLQPYEKEKFGQAIDLLPDQASGATLLQQGLRNLDTILAGAVGRTVVFLFTDGQYSRMSGTTKPIDIAKRLTEKYNVCFYVISTASDEANRAMLEKVASVSECSRVVPFEAMYERPVYLAGALFVIDYEVRNVFFTETNRLIELEIDNVLFDVDSSSVQEDFHDEISILGQFLANNPETYVLLTGYTDSTGSAGYNLGLSRKRAEAVQQYLITNFNVGIGRVITQWYGETNPVADNAQPEGRQQNRRVEMIVMGID